LLKYILKLFQPQLCAFASLRETTTQKLTSLQDKQQVKHHTFHFNFAPLRLCEKPQPKTLRLCKRK